MKTIYSQNLIRKTDRSEERITVTVTVKELPNYSEFHLSYGGMKTDWHNSLSSSPIVGQIEGSPYPTAEIAIGFAKNVIERKIEAGYILVEVDEEPPSHNGDFQTHVRRMPPRS
jgi:hypothetical protein